jgi:hypothetical protein
METSGIQYNTIYTPLGTTNNYSAVADFFTLYKSLHAKSSPVYSAFNSRSLAMASNNEDSSASRAHVLP